jgi:hypothetical protein
LFDLCVAQATVVDEVLEKCQSLPSNKQLQIVHDIAHDVSRANTRAVNVVSPYAAGAKITLGLETA